MSSGRGSGYILQKRPPAPTPNEKSKKQRRADGLAPAAASVISSHRDIGPLEVQVACFCVARLHVRIAEVTRSVCPSCNELLHMCALRETDGTYRGVKV